MMNYQYPQTYILDNPEQLIKMATPPPMLPSLDPTEVEQLSNQPLYQRRENETLQQLQINGYQYYTPTNQSAPVTNKNAINNTSAVLFSKTPRTDYIDTKHAVKVPSTPPPPIVPGINNISGSISSKIKGDIVAITPQSHANMNSNSASNHSTQSNNTTATTHIESASNHSSHPSHHSHHSHHSHEHGHIQQLQPTNQIVTVNKMVNNNVPVPQLANPLPPLKTDIVIPMDQNNYYALLSQMNPQYTSNTYVNNNPYSRHNYQPPVQDDINDIYGNPMAAPFNIYGTYDTNSYLYNTPPLPNNNGYYAPQKHYYQQPVPVTNQTQSHTYHAHTHTPTHNAYAYNNATYSNNNTVTSPTNNYYSNTQVVNTSPTHNTHNAHNTHTITKNAVANTSIPSTNDINAKVQYLQRCDGTIISPNADPLTIRNMLNRNKDDEADAFTAGDDALFGNNMVTIIAVNWTTNIPYATIRMHQTNRQHHVPLMDLTHINTKTMANKQQHKVIQNNRYRIGGSNNNNNNNNKVVTPSNNNNIIIRRNPKLSDETLMKLPHLRKHRDYIRQMDTAMGPKDYNSYRVSVNSKQNNSGDADEGNNNNNNNASDSNNISCGRTANIQNLNAKNSNINLNANLNANNKRKNKRMSACEKGDLFKTELCENWVKKGHCTYGKKCHFAHGRDDIRTRWRIENYKTQPCCDPARADSRLCLFGKRCNYAHPGEPLRRSHHCLYLDEEYQAEILKDYGQQTPYPFGIYI